MTYVVLFSGQGDQGLEHLAALIRMSGEASTTFGKSIAELGLNLEMLDLDNLSANRIAQPMICAYQLAIWQELSVSSPTPALCSGYSLGQVAAMGCAGAFSVRDAIELAAVRAHLMDEATPEASGLLAIIGFDQMMVDRLCGINNIQVAIRNGPRHAVVGGNSTALEHFADEAARLGALRLIPLNVKTPSHTAALSKATRKFEPEISEKGLAPLRIPLMSGIDARTITSETMAAKNLAREISNTLNWFACMNAIVERAPKAVLEIGPGNALSQMFRNIAPDLPVRSVDEFRSVHAAGDWVQAQIGRAPNW